MTLAATDAENIRTASRRWRAFRDEEPNATAWGTQAIIADPDGNTFAVAV